MCGVMCGMCEVINLFICYRFVQGLFSKRSRQLYPREAIYT